MEISSKKATGSAAGLSAARFQKYGSESLRDLGIEKEWAGKISFGGEDFFVIIDTGSSDTWLAQTGFQCLDINGEKISQADCKFGPLYNGTFDEGKIKDVSSCGVHIVHVVDQDANSITGELQH